MTPPQTLDSFKGVMASPIRIPIIVNPRNSSDWFNGRNALNNNNIYNSSKPLAGQVRWGRSCPARVEMSLLNFICWKINRT